MESRTQIQRWEPDEVQLASCDQGVDEDADKSCLLIPIPGPYAAWIAYCLVQDLHRRGPNRNARLTTDEALGFLYFILDLLPPRLRPRSELPPRHFRKRRGR